MKKYIVEFKLKAKIIIEAKDNLEAQETARIKIPCSWHEIYLPDGVGFDCCPVNVSDKIEIISCKLK